MNQHGRNRQPLMLAALAVGMFGFAFALVPLYDVFCELTGINGKTSNQAALLEEINASAVPVDRTVTISFLGSSARGMPWEFRPIDRQLVVRPGEMYNTAFYARNRSSTTVTGQAVPSVTPGLAALHMKKLECFCFEQQELPPYGETEMGVSFVIDADLPPDITELTLSYTMFRIANVEHEHMASHNE